MYVRPSQTDQRWRDYIAAFYTKSKFRSGVAKGKYTLAEALRRIDHRVSDADLPEIQRLIGVWEARDRDRQSRGEKIHRVTILERNDVGTRIVKKGDPFS